MHGSALLGNPLILHPEFIVYALGLVQGKGTEGQMSLPPSPPSGDRKRRQGPMGPWRL